MFAVMGITGQVGGAVARTLLTQGSEVRGMVRSRDKAAVWSKQGVALALADFNDADALARAFSDVQGAFVMLPPMFAPSVGFPESKRGILALKRALELSRPPKVVALSSVGAQRSEGIGLIHALHMLEQELSALDLPITFLRAAWFMDNAAWDVDPARQGAISSFLQPLDRTIPMVAAADVGDQAAGILLSARPQPRVVELEGPAAYSPQQLAACFAAALGQPVGAAVVPRERWSDIFHAQGSSWPAPRIEMLDGFNSGWLDFERGDVELRRGRLTLDEVVRELIKKKA